MKPLLLSILLLATFSSAQAQYVTIPDTAFRNLLMSYYPGAFNASKQMDTNNSYILNETSICINQPPAYWWMTVGGPSFTSNHIKDVWGIQFFKNVLRLGIWNTDIVALPPMSGMTYSNVQIHIHDNPKLKTVQSLPPSVRILDISHNAITTLCPVPTVLDYLDCGNNQLTQLTLRGPESMVYCDSNQITTIDNLPAGLMTLDCSYNPHLPCLPRLPNSLNTLNATYTSISCLPNKPVVLSSGLPICPAGGCTPHPAASGLCFIDHDGNNKYNSSIDEPLMYGVLTNNTSFWTATSDHTGAYTIGLDSGKTNTFALRSFRYVKSITPVSYSVTPASVALQSNNYDFAVQMIPNVRDLEVSMTGLAARHQGRVSMVVTNRGTVGMTNVSLKLVKPSFANSIITRPTAAGEYGDTVVWTGISLGAAQSMAFHLNWDITNWVNPGTLYKLTAIASPIVGDTMPDDNVEVIEDTIRRSWDPNEILVNKTSLPVNQLSSELVYTVRFQNTGNDTAFNIMVQDQLSNKLDWGTFRMIGGSHEYVASLKEKGLLEVSFPSIGLPDSGKNYIASQGFFQYAIRPAASLKKGDTIPNTASIYFDTNPAVVTNTAKTVITDAVPIAVKPVSKTEVAQVYPNPVKDVLHIRLSDVSGRLVLCDISGREVLSRIIATEAEVDLHGLPSGMLIGRIETSTGVKVFKLNKLD